MALHDTLSFDTRSQAPDDIDDAVGLVVDVVRTLPLEEAVARTARYQAWFVALEAELLARNKAAGASDRSNEDLAGRGRKTTKADAKRRAKRGAAVGENPDLADDLASGELGNDQMDAIADAAAKTSGDAARDQTLIDNIKNSPPDEARDIAKKWIHEHNHPDDDAADKRRARQRRMRDVSKFETKDGCSAILLKGDDESITEMWDALKAAAKKLWKKDGGRNLPTKKHPRSRAQRLFDAAHQNLIQGSSAGSDPSTRSPSATLHMWVQLDDFLAGKHNATFANGSLVPAAVLARHMCSGTIASTVFDKHGEVLHHGRQHRYATRAQIRGLIARDKACVLCRADVSECEAHHLTPWNAPQRGETNIEDMAMVCSDCHHFIHDLDQTMYRDSQQRWKLRPATAGETPPAGPRSQAEPPSAMLHQHKVRHE